MYHDTTTEVVLSGIFREHVERIIDDKIRTRFGTERDEGSLRYDRFARSTVVSSQSGRTDTQISSNGDVSTLSLDISGTAITGIITSNDLLTTFTLPDNSKLMTWKACYDTFVQLSGMESYVLMSYLLENYLSSAQIAATYFNKEEMGIILTGYLMIGSCYTKSEMDSKLITDYYSKNQLDYMLLGYVSYSWLQLNHYTRTEISELLANYYTKIDIDNRLTSFYYTKDDSDGRYLQEADLEGYVTTSLLASTCYTKTEIQSDYYTKLASDLRYATPAYVTNFAHPKSYVDTELGNRYTKTESDAQFLSKADAGTTYLSKTEASGTYLSKTEASGTYLSKTDAGTTYLSKTDAGTTYLSKSEGEATYVRLDELMDTIYPIGTIYTSYVSGFDPNTKWPGTTWVAIDGKFLYSDHTQSPGTNGGSNTVTLTADNIPPHTHDFVHDNLVIDQEKIYNSIMDASINYLTGNTLAAWRTTNTQNGHSGTQTSVNIMPSYTVVRSWRRTN